jgi:cystathionine beta-lyase
LRIEKHCRNAQAVAEFLETHPAVDKVFYPGLKTHPNHTVAKKQSKGFGGIVSFTLKDNTEEAAIQFVTQTQLFKLAESLGGIKSLVSHPANMTHKSIPAEKRRAAGVSDSLIRLSIGLEDAEDLVADIAGGRSDDNHISRLLSCCARISVSHPRVAGRRHQRCLLAAC